MKKFSLAMTALAVAASFGLSANATVLADATAMEDLQNRLVELQQSANNIQARADAERRPLSGDETTEIEQIFAAFADVEADISRRQQLDDINARVSAPAQRRTAPELTETDPPESSEAPTQRQPQASSGGGQPARRVQPAYAAPRTTDAGKWGFRSSAEYLHAVMRASAKGAVPDPRLIANATPSTFGSEGTGQDGGFAVPPDFRNTIIQKVMGEDSLLSMTDQQTSSGNSITFPADETTPWQSSGGIQAYWEAEGGQKQQSKPSLVEKTVKLNKLIALVPLTDELLEDAPAMAGYVNRKAPEKINFKVSDAILSGSGIGMPLGILKSPGTVVITKEASQPADTILFQNIMKLYGALTPQARRNGRWIMNPDVEQALYSMAFPNAGSGAAVPVFLPPGGLSGSPYAMLLGRPIITTEAAPALGDQGDIIFGDMNQYLSAVKSGGIRTDVSIHIWFDYDITAFRFVLRVGGQPWWNAPITGFQPGSAQRGFFATLAERT